MGPEDLLAASEESETIPSIAYAEVPLSRPGPGPIFLPGQGRENWTSAPWGPGTELLLAPAKSNTKVGTQIVRLAHIPTARVDDFNAGMKSAGSAVYTKSTQNAPPPAKDKERILDFKVRGGEQELATPG